MQLQNKIVSQLARNEIFAGLTEKQIGDILPCIMLEIKDYGKEECIYDKNDMVNALGVVLEGHLLICDETINGKRTTIANIRKDQLFGEMMLFSTISRIPHRVIAAGETKVIFLSGSFFLAICSNVCERKNIHQEIMRNMLRVLSDKAIMLNKKISYLTAPDLKTKIAMYLLELYDQNKSHCFEMPMKRDQLAEFFSVARPSLSREMVNLKNDGIIDFHRSSVTIIDLESICEIAQSNKD